jgi:group I intron endonuclease
MLVYKVTSPSGKYYIGITSTTLNFRKAKHIAESKRNTNYKFHNAIRKYGKTLVWEVIESNITCYEKLKELEKYYIQYFDSFHNGYNCTLGGDGIFGYKHSEESKSKMKGNRPQTSAALKNKPKSLEHRKNLSKARKELNLKLSDEQKQKISNFMSNYKSDIEIRNKAAIANGGKPFLVFKDANLIGRWVSQRQCARELNLQQSYIGKCLKNNTKNKTHKGYTFRYEEA